MQIMEMALTAHIMFVLKSVIEIEGVAGDGQIKLSCLNMNGVSGDDVCNKYGQYMQPTLISPNLVYRFPLVTKYGTGIQTRNMFTIEFINTVGKICQTVTWSSKSNATLYS